MCDWMYGYLCMCVCVCVVVCLCVSVPLTHCWQREAKRIMMLGYCGGEGVEGLALIAGLFSQLFSHGPVSARVMKLALKLNECCQLAVGRMQDPRLEAGDPRQTTVSLLASL